MNQLYYYSYLKNKISELFSLEENHSGGCLFLDNSAKNILKKLENNKEEENKDNSEKEKNKIEKEKTNKNEEIEKKNK